MVYPENTVNVPLLVGMVTAEVALYPAHRVVVAPRNERNPFIGLAGYTHAEANPVELNSHYICFPPDLKGREFVSSEATFMALEGAKESRMALAHLDATLEGGPLGPCNAFFYQLYQNAQDIKLITRYRPEDLLNWVLFDKVPVDIRTRINSTLRKDDDFLLGLVPGDAANFVAKFATHTTLNSHQVITKGQTLLFTGDYPVVPTGRYTNHDQEIERTLLYYYQGYLSANLTSAQKVSYLTSKWDQRLNNLIRSVCRCPYFWAYYYAN